MSSFVLPTTSITKIHRKIGYWLGKESIIIPAVHSNIGKGNHFWSKIIQNWMESLQATCLCKWGSLFDSLHQINVVQHTTQLFICLWTCISNKNKYKNVKALGINLANSHITLEHKMFTLSKDFSGDKCPRASFILMIALHLRKLSQSQYMLALNHFFGWITPWKQLLNNGSDRPECLLIIWLMKDRNLAQMTCPFPLNVVVALQYKWFSQGFIHSAIHSQPFSLHSFDRTFLISRVKTGEMRCATHLHVLIQ